MAKPELRGFHHNAITLLVHCLASNRQTSKNADRPALTVKECPVWGGEHLRATHFGHTQLPKWVPAFLSTRLHPILCAAADGLNFKDECLKFYAICTVTCRDSCCVGAVNVSAMNGAIVRIFQHCKVGEPPILLTDAFTCEVMVPLWHSHAFLHVGMLLEVLQGTSFMLQQNFILLWCRN